MTYRYCTRRSETPLLSRDPGGRVRPHGPWSTWPAGLFTGTATLGIMLLCLVASGCRSYEFTITGTITQYAPGDTVFVTLTHTWDNITAPPRRFSIDPAGRFELVFTMGALNLPVTFVRNDELYAKLTVHHLGDASPILYDEVRGRSFDLVVESEGKARAEVTL